MANFNQIRYFVGDFETTVYEGQARTDVWASGLCELFTEDAHIFASIDDTFAYLFKLTGNLVIYYHNLKFDGSFILDYLLRQPKIVQALNKDDTGEHWVDKNRMRNWSLRYAISNRGQWYNIVLKHKGRYIEFRDSVKLLPYSVKKLGEDFGTKHQKTSIEYKGYRKPNGIITDKERFYLKNDLFVVKECLEVMFKEGHKGLTIGSCCMRQYKSIFGKELFGEYYPNLYKINIDSDKAKTQGEFILKSYKGGYCYCAPEKRGRILTNGVTLDVNSLYPYKMHSRSCERYPVGIGTHRKGPIPVSILKDDNLYYFIRIKCRFKVKKGYLPFIQIKGNCHYDGTEHLTTSDIRDEDGKYCDTYVDLDGFTRPANVDMVLTKDDYELFKLHYIIKDLQEIEYIYFDTDIGMFDDYINEWAEVKQNSVGAKRGIAKLFSNNLYGQFAKSTDSSFKVARIDQETDTIKMRPVTEHKKEPGYIAIGSAITSKCRRYTITHAQANYHGSAPGFCYSDTDSVHMDIPASQVKGFDIDKKIYGYWDLELEWDVAYFSRQKTYIEQYINDEGEVDYKLTCAGMPDRCKDLFIKSIKKGQPDNDLERSFFLNDNGDYINRDMTSLDKGLRVPGKLKPKRYPGGVVLIDGDFTYH